MWWRHGYTYGGHAGAAAAAMANLDIIEREQLLDGSARLEKSLHATLAPLADLDAVAEVRSGIGALAAVQLAEPPRPLVWRSGCAATASRPARSAPAASRSRPRS